MGGKQKIVRQEAPSLTHFERVKGTADKYKRICQSCNKITYAFECCGKRTRRVKDRTLGDVVVER